MENKNRTSFVLHNEYRERFDKLKDEEAGILIKHIFHFVNGDETELDDRFLDMVFLPIKQQLERDFNKWDEIRKKRAVAGRAGGKKRVKNLKQNQANQANAKSVKQNQANQAINTNTSIDINSDNKFDSFWGIYDKKTGRKACVAKWGKLSLNDREEIFKRLPDYIKATPDKKYRKDPITYLNQEAWTDEIVVEKANMNHNGKSQSSMIKSI